MTQQTGRSGPHGRRRRSAPVACCAIAASTLLSACSVVSGSGQPVVLGVSASSAAAGSPASTPSAASTAGTLPPAGVSITSGSGALAPPGAGAAPTSAPTRARSATGASLPPAAATGASVGTAAGGSAAAGSADGDGTTAGGITSGGPSGALGHVASVGSAAVPLLLGPGTESLAESQVVGLVNLARTSAGCAPVSVDPVLVELARAHSLDMAGSGGFRHNGSDGRTPFQRMTAAGYDYAIAAENIAAGQPNASAVMDAWMASPGYQQNIVNCQLTQVGVGVVNRPGSRYVTYWTQDFAAPM